MKNKYNFKEVIFKDTFFTYDKKWLKEFIYEYRNKIKVPFKCFGKLEHFDEDTAGLLKQGGCYCVEFGIQTWNEDIRRRILNRFETNEQAKRVFQICDNYELWYDIDHMFGIPYETKSDHIMATKEYARMKYLNRVKCHNLVYLPGLKITEYGNDCGVITDEYISRLSEGVDADFFNTTRETEKMKKVNESFRKLFKVIKLLPEDIIDKKIYGLFRFIPMFLIYMGQLIQALHSHDLRFKIYLKNYPLKLKTALENII